MSLTLFSRWFGGARSHVPVMKPAAAEATKTEPPHDDAGKARLSADGAVSTTLGDGVSVDSRGRLGFDLGGITFRSDGSFDIGTG